MMLFSAILGILFLIIPLAYLLTSLVGLTYLWYRVLKGKRGGDLPTCAKCGYAVRGLPGLDCPECGADLREVGIVTPKQRGAVSPVLFVLVWTLLLPGPSCLVSGLLVWVGPKTKGQINDTLDLTPIASGEYQNANINQIGGMSWYAGTNYTQLNILGNTSQFENLQIDPVAMTYEDQSSISSGNTTVYTGATTKPLDRQALLDMLKRAGADITRQDVMDEADELLSIIQGIPTQGLGGLTPTHFTQNYYSNSYDQPAGWFMLVLLGVWVLVWVGGLVWFFRIRSKQIPTVQQGLSDPARFAPSSPSGPAGPPSAF